MISWSCCCCCCYCVVLGWLDLLLKLEREPNKAMSARPKIKKIRRRVLAGSRKGEKLIFPRLAPKHRLLRSKIPITLLIKTTTITTLKSPQQTTKKRKRNKPISPYFSKNSAPLQLQSPNSSPLSSQTFLKISTPPVFKAPARLPPTQGSKFGVKDEDDG